MVIIIMNFEFLSSSTVINTVDNGNHNYELWIPIFIHSNKYSRQR